MDAATVLGSTAAMKPTTPKGLFPHRWLGYGALGFLLVVLGAGPLVGADGARPKIGDQAPDFTLVSSGGENVTLSSLRGQKKVLLIFFRGTW